MLPYTSYKKNYAIIQELEELRQYVKANNYNLDTDEMALNAMAARSMLYDNCTDVEKERMADIQKRVDERPIVVDEYGRENSLCSLFKI